jgi:hypothetical protein
MGLAIIDAVENEEQAKGYVQCLVHECGYDRERLFILHEPDLYPERPFTVNVD